MAYDANKDCFFIGDVKGRDNRNKWLMPFNLWVIAGECSFQQMPSSESTYIEIPSMDGSIVQDTTYKNRAFTIVAETKVALYEDARNQVKADIVEQLRAIKGVTKQLYIEESDIYFDCRYSGNATFSKRGDYLRVSIPLEVEAMGYGETVSFEGDGTIYNNGDAPIGAKFIFASGTTNPRFYVGGEYFYWSGTVPTGSTLVIDATNYTCYTLSASLERTNAMASLSYGSDFFRLLEGEETAVVAYNDTTRNNMTTEYKPLYLWNSNGG